MLGFRSRKIELYPHQKRAQSWLREHPKGCLSLKMGQGKTITILRHMVWMDKHGSQEVQKTYLVLVPKSLLHQWHRQIEKALFVRGQRQERPLVHVYHGRGVRCQWKDAKVILSTPLTWLSSYQKGRIPSHVHENINGVVIDEVHLLRNERTVQYTMLKSYLSRWCPRYIYGLTGTPVINRPSDITTLSKLLLKSQVHIESDKLDTFLYRGSTTNMTNRVTLPPLHEHRYAVSLKRKEQRIHRALCARIASYLHSILHGESAVDISMNSVLYRLSSLLRLFSYFPKEYNDSYGTSSKLDVVLSLLGYSPRDGIPVIPPTDKVVVFSRFYTTLSSLEHIITTKYGGTNVLFYSGRLSLKERKCVLEEFETNPEKTILFMTLQSGSTGLDLQCANHVICIDQWWNQAVHEQAIHRVHRIGQQKEVHLYEIFAKHTIDDSWLYPLRLTKGSVQSYMDRNVSLQTVTSIFNEKRGILGELFRLFLYSDITEQVNSSLRASIDKGVLNEEIPTILGHMGRLLESKERVIQKKEVDWLEELWRRIGCFSKYTCPAKEVQRFYQIKGKDENDEDDDCPVCLCSFSTNTMDEVGIRLGCNHILCASCFFQLLRMHLNGNDKIERHKVRCPMCRNNDKPLSKTIQSTSEEMEIVEGGNPLVSQEDISDHLSSLSIQIPPMNNTEVR